MPEHPEIVCVCGSMRFAEDMRAVSRSERFGESTTRKIDYARAAGKPVTFVGPAWGSQ